MVTKFLPNSLKTFNRTTVDINHKNSALHYENKMKWKRKKIPDVAKRLSIFAKYKGLTPNQFALECGLPNGYINSIRRSVPTDTFKERIEPAFPELNTYWLITGEGEMLNNSSEAEKAKDSNYIAQRRGLKNSDKEENVPVYDVDFIAGTNITTYDDLTETTPSYTVYFPQFKGCVGFNVYNDSMEPKITSGSLVFARPIFDFENDFEYGNIFGIVLKDGRRLLKYLKKSKDEYKFLAVSENTFYDEFEIRKSSIKTLWQVEGWVNRNS